MIKGFPLLLTMLSLAAIPLSSEAIVLAGYDFTDGSLAPTSFASGLAIAGNITSIVDADPVIDNAEFATYTTGGNPDGQISDGFSGSNQTSAISNGDYFSFTLSAAAGQTLTLTDMTLDARVTSGSGNRVFFVRTSQNAFASTLYLSGDLNNTTFSNFDIDLSSLAPVTDSTPIEFRIYTYMEGANRQMFYDNIVVNGAVPEPGTVVMLGVCGLGLMVWKRRRAS